MEILFCDRCHESIPETDLESGRSVRVSGRLLHIGCALQRASRPRAGVLAPLLSVLAVGGAAYAVFRPPAAKPVDTGALAAQWQADVEQGVKSLGAEVGKLLEVEVRAREAQARGLAASVRDDVAVAQRAELDRAVALLQAKLEAYNDAHVRRFEAGEAQLREIATWMKEVRELAVRSPGVPEPSAPPAAPAVPPVAQPRPPAGPSVPAAPAGPEKDVEAQKRHDADVDRQIGRLKDPDPGTSFSAAYRLQELKDLRAVPALVEAVKNHRDTDTRFAATIALGELRACDGVPTLIEAIEDKDDGVRTVAAESLAKITGRDVRILVGLTKKERRQMRDEWAKWWKDNEAAVRERLGQPAAKPTGSPK